MRLFINHAGGGNEKRGIKSEAALMRDCCDLISNGIFCYNGHRIIFFNATKGNQMQKYIGTKQLNAKPMTRMEYVAFRGWDLPADENGEDEGFLVEYLDGGKANTAAYEGYVSWSPKDVFEKAYRPVDGMSFGLAVEAMMSGDKKAARIGWNGKGMFLFGVRLWGFETDINGVDGIDTLPFICMKTADNKLVPWLASQTDIQADDWVIVD